MDDLPKKICCMVRFDRTTGNYEATTDQTCWHEATKITGTGAKPDIALMWWAANLMELIRGTRELK